jgi:dipeptide/tripeptide permease
MSCPAPDTTVAVVEQDAPLEMEMGMTLFAFAVGRGKFWVLDLFTVGNPNYGMSLLFGSCLLEIVLGLIYAPAPRLIALA